ncbi:MAG TPA: SDR family NAD(P)-dependent oxidoreductase [Polyangiaceae bacterium]|nr:SDR family NAD(P)-dependent oxidoreductase [Polyangiaceae bacterium]
MIDLRGKTVLVTGAAQGIGFGIAEVLAAAGAHVLVNDRRSGETHAAVARLRDRGFSVEPAVADLTVPEQITQMVEQRVAPRQELHGLVNNAGIARFGGIEETTLDTWNSIMDIQLRAHYLVTRAALPWLRAAGQASVTCISSVHSLLTVPTMLAYASAKGAVIAMVRALSQELGPQGIRVNAVSPGFVDTPLFRGWLESEPDPAASLARVLDQIPLRRIASPQDVGQLVAFLTSELALQLTGANLVLDGGLTTQLKH